jgi:hypothetical protein
MRERAEFVTLDVKTLAPPRRVHRGWSWFCGCAAFAREEHDRYLYVPCVAHTAPRERGAQPRGAAESSTVS